MTRKQKRTAIIVLAAWLLVANMSHVFAEEIDKVTGFYKTGVLKLTGLLEPQSRIAILGIQVEIGAPDMLHSDLKKLGYDDSISAEVARLRLSTYLMHEGNDVILKNRPLTPISINQTILPLLYGRNLMPYGVIDEKTRDQLVIEADADYGLFGKLAQDKNNRWVLTVSDAGGNFPGAEDITEIDHLVMLSLIKRAIDS